MRLSTKVAINTLVQIISKGLATVLGLAAIAIITRQLGQNGFGEYTTIITFLSFFGIIADLGLTLVTTQILSEPDVKQDEALGNLLGLRLVSALLFLGLAPVAVIFFPYSDQVKAGVALTALSFFFIALNQILVALFQKNLRMDKVSIAEVSSRIVLLFGIIISANLDWGLYGILGATVFSSFSSFALHLAFSRRFARIRLKFDPDYWRMIMRKSWPLALTIALNLIYLKSDTLFLSFLPRNSEIGIVAEVGVYGAAYKVIDVLITLPFMFAGIILPILSKRWQENSKKQFFSILQKSFDVLVLAALPLAVGTQFVAAETMSLVAGQDFAVSGPVLRILIWAATAIFLGNMFAHAIIAIGKQKDIIKAYFFVAISSVLGYLLAIPHFSYSGAAWVTIYSETAIALASYYIVWKNTRFCPDMRVFFKSAFACALMAVALFILRHTQTDTLPIMFVSAISVYTISLYALKTFDRKEIMDILNK